MKLRACFPVLALLASVVALAFPVAASPETSNLTELQRGWRMTSANNVTGDDAAVSRPGFDVSKWYTIQRMPATVLQVLEDNGVYKDLYYGMNLTKPGDLWKQDWWYRTTFSVPAGAEAHTLIVKGINYRADIWLNGHKVADKWQAAGMYNRFEFDVTKYINSGGENTLAVKVTPERGLVTEDGK